MWRPYKRLKPRRPGQVRNLAAQPQCPADERSQRRHVPIEPPVIAVGDGQLELFRSPDRLAGSIEAVDAELSATWLLSIDD